LNRNAGATAGAVGTYAFANSTTASDVSFGSTRAGSALRPVSAFSSVGFAAISESYSSATGSALAGTWQAMGYYDHVAFSASAQGGGATLWLRIS
jgi:hypothetical protein